MCCARNTASTARRCQEHRSIGCPAPIQTKEVGAILVVLPLIQKYLSQVRDFFHDGPKAVPVLIPINSAATIAEADRAYESFDVPKGTLRGAPPVPDDDLTTLRTSLYLVAKKELSSNLMAEFTQTIMAVRRDLLSEQPILAQMTAPSTDARCSTSRSPRGRVVLRRHPTELHRSI